MMINWIRRAVDEWVVRRQARRDEEWDDLCRLHALVKQEEAREAAGLLVLVESDFLMLGEAGPNQGEG